ncbi:MAG TPA: hypothetical protein VMF64_11740 [Steroidobacteraceae bacterium]|nr:hypothetical protein [Steroidobacteraceae bacterium]
MVRLKVIAAACLIVPVATLAQTTYDYSGELMNGTQSYVGINPYVPIITTTPIDLAVSGALTLAEPLGANLHKVSVNPLSFAFQVNGAGFDAAGPSAPMYPPQNTGDSFIFSTNAIGAITNWSVSLSSSLEQVRGPLTINFQSSPDGDSYIAQEGGFPGGALSSEAMVSNTIAGVWSGPPSAAPEIDPADTMSGLTILAGLLLVSRGRRSASATSTLAAGKS